MTPEKSRYNRVKSFIITLIYFQNIRKTAQKIMMRFLKLILLIAIPVIVYANSLQNTFVYDDVFTITDNYFIRNWGNFPHLFTSEYFKSSGEATYRPVVTLSYFIDYSIWHLNPLGFHLTNVLLHTTSVLLVYFLLTAFVKDKVVPFLTGVLFALHPILTEAVNGISYREDILAVIFFLCSIFSYIQSNRHPNKYAFLYPISLLSYLIALFSKEMAITLPFIILLFDWVFNCSATIKKNAIKYYLGFILVSIFYLSIRFIWLYNPVEKQIVHPDNSFLTSIFTMPKIFCAYIKLLFFPISLNADYIITHTKNPMAVTFIVSIAFLSVIGIITYRFYYYSKSLFFLSLWFYITLLPTTNIVPIANIMAERYLYLPSIGFFAILAYIPIKIWRRLCLLISEKDLYKKSFANEIINFTIYKPVLITTSLLILILTIPYSISTIKRNMVWINPLVFWSKTIELSPRSSRAHNNLGMIYNNIGKLDLAIREFQTAVFIESDPEFHHNLGMAYQKKGMKVEALQEYNRVLAVNPNSSFTYNNIGNILIDYGRIDEGISKFKEALRLKPNYYDAHFNLGLAYYKKKLFDDSINEFKLAIHYEPDRAKAHHCLGIVYANKDMLDKAIVEMEEAIRLKPDYAEAYKNLGIIYMKYKKNTEKALYYFNEFLKLDPSNKDAGTIKKTIEILQSKN